MLISIIVPAYNCEKTIIKCLESLSKQSYHDVEIIIIDDGSKDNTLKIIREYSQTDNRVKIITQENCGPGAARNAGLKMAKGEYFTFVDADDTVESSYIESMLLLAEKNKLDLVLCKFKTNKVLKKKISGKCRVVNDKQDILSNIVLLIKEGVLNSPYCKLYRTALQKKYDIYMPTTVDIGEDLQFNLMYIQHTNTIGILDLYLYNYHIENSTLTKKYRPNEYETRVKNIQMLDNFFDNNGIVERQFINFMYLKLMYAECMNMHSHIDKNKRLKRINVLLKKNEIQLAINQFLPVGILQKIMIWGCKTQNAKRIDCLAMLLNLGRRMVPRMKRASI